MKTHIKIWSKLVFASMIAFSVGYLQLAKPAEAATNPSIPANECFNSLKFTNVAKITCTASNWPTDGANSEFIFVDVEPYDGTPNYVLQNNPSNLFCDSATNSSLTTLRSIDYGINAKDSLLPNDIGNSKDKLNVQFALGISLESFGGQSPTGSQYPAGCYPFGFRDFVSQNNNFPGQFDFKNTLASQAQNAKIWLQWDTSNNRVVSLTEVTKGNLASKTYVGNPAHNPPNDKSIAIYESDTDFTSANPCNGEVIALQLNNSGESKQIAKEFTLGKLDPNNGFIDTKNFQELDWFTNKLSVNCGVKANYTGMDQWFSIGGTAPTANQIKNASGSVNGVGSTLDLTGGGLTDGDEACFNSGWALSWVACPVITAAQSLANTLYEFVEDQLSFRVPQDVGGADGGINKAWNNFRILVSGLVVILLLVMVIGQAIGTGPFDAYTVKKMLPRVVAGVILIQLSWPIFSFVINFVDDLGRGLADIMYAPFGGASKLNLNDVMKGFEGYAGPFSWIGIVGSIVGVLVVPFLLLGVLLTVLVALFAGFLTLLFRKILIILALILAPVALIAWMMPNDGLRRYWKLWWDNFIKALMMFPLIIVIIAGGRIFAKVGSTTHDFVGFFIVLIGFFGPLFILPKTFKWGGSAMQFAGNAISNAQAKTLKKPKEFLGERQKTLKEQRGFSSAQRLANWESGKFNRRQKIGSALRGDKLRSGDWDPTLRGWATLGIGRKELGRARESKMAHFAAAATKGHQEEVQNESLRLRSEMEGYHRDDQDRVRRAIMMGTKINVKDVYGKSKVFDGAEGRNPLRVRAAADTAAQQGGEQHFKAVDEWVKRIERKGSDEERTEVQRFLQDNVQSLFTKMPHLYKGIGGAARESQQTIASMSGSTIETILAELSIDARDTTSRVVRIEPDGTEVRETEGEVAERRRNASQNLNTFLHNYQKAASNENLMGNLNSAGILAVRSFVGYDPLNPRAIETRTLDQINKKRSNDEAPAEGSPPTFTEIHEIDGRVGASPYINQEIREALESTIDEGGRIK